MKKLFPALFMLLTVSAFAQSSNKDLDEKIRQLDTQTADINRSMQAADSVYKQQTKRLDSEAMERNNQNLNSLVSEMKERDRKAKQAMWIRLGFGILLAGVGIFSIFRKRKPKK